MLPDLPLPPDDVDVRDLCPYVQQLIDRINALSKVQLVQDQLGHVDMTSGGVAIDLSGLVQSFRTKGINLETN